LLINPNFIGINEIFISKYTIGGQTYLKKHRDDSEFSFVIKLNDEFNNGGTHFYNSIIDDEKKINYVPKMEIGDCLIFSGQNKHKALKITSGTRYILTGFFHWKNKDYCTNIIKSYF
jgi:hypothetical protein